MGKLPRIDAELWVFYKEFGSTILHKRDGRYTVTNTGSFIKNCPLCPGYFSG